jgi:hypothetical protein
MQRNAHTLHGMNITQRQAEQGSPKLTHNRKRVQSVSWEDLIMRKSDDTDLLAVQKLVQYHERFPMQAVCLLCIHARKHSRKAKGRRMPEECEGVSQKVLGPVTQKRPIIMGRKWNERFTGRKTQNKNTGLREHRWPRPHT